MQALGVEHEAERFPRTRTATRAHARRDQRVAAGVGGEQGERRVLMRLIRAGSERTGLANVSDV